MYLQVNVSTVTEAIYIASGVAVFLVFVLVLLAVLYRKSHNIYLKEKEFMNAQFNEALLQSQVEVQEATYSILGKELHDNVGQLLSSAKMLIGITERNIGIVPETLTVANDTLGKAISELRSLSKSLNKEWLEQFDLIDNLQMEADRINPAGGIQILLTHPDKLDVTSDRQVIVFRLIQEAMQNAIKHSGASQVRIDVVSEERLLNVSIKDNGSGMISEGMKEGVGLLNMRHRVKLLEGKIDWINTPEGVEVKISVPTKKKI